MEYLTNIRIDTFIQKAWHTEEEEDAIASSTPMPSESPYMDKQMRALARQEDGCSNASIFV